MDISKLYKDFENCYCGKEHTCPIEHIKIERNALAALPQICEPYSNILLVSDENTYKVCGKNVYELISDKIYSNLILEPNGKIVIPNEEKMAEIEDKLTEKTDLIIGVGSGVINDMCKYVSFNNNLPYFIVATAPSMDGYASGGATLILGGLKVTVSVRPAKAIIADTEVLMNAPVDMLRSGYGDIIGKYSCLNDWKLSTLINNEYFCQKVYDMVYDCTKKVESLGDVLLSHNEEAARALMEALVKVGIAMSFVKYSRPASASEHHLSHFFEITGILDKKEHFPHGIDVAFSSVEVAKIREKILSSKPVKRLFDRKEWEENIRRLYSTSADSVINLQDSLGWYEKDDSQIIEEKWSEITKIISEAPSVGDTLKMLERVGLDYSDFEKMYGREKIENAALYGKDLRDRYSVLWLNYTYFR